MELKSKSMSAKPESEKPLTSHSQCDCLETPCGGSDGNGIRAAVKISAAIIAAVLGVSVAAWLLFRAVFVNIEPPSYQNEFPAMGTVAKVTVYSSENDLVTANEICQREFDTVSRICSLYDPESELSRLNASAASAPFVCSPEMWELLLRSKQAYIDSDGYFDITVKPLMDLWGFYRQRGKNAPTDMEIAQTMSVIGFDKLQFDEKRRTILFTRPGMALDLGGIAKGYVADRAAAKIAAAGICTGVIDIGGNLRMLPELPPRKDFYRVAVRDPRDRNKVLPEPLKVKANEAVSTSGDYERFVTYNGKKYGHIISPKDGRPSIVSAVTVIADTAMDADVFSTSCSLGGEALAEKLRAKYPNIQIYFTR